MYDYEEKTILITYGMKNGFYYSAIIGNKMEMVGEIESLVTGTAYIPGDSENQGDWEIEVLTADNLSGQYNGSIGTARIIAYHGDYGDIEIPNTIYYTEAGVTKGYSVTELGSSLFAFYNDEDAEKITSITLNQGLKVIRAGCFKHDTLLACKIVFPSSLIYIGDSAFYNCEQLEGDLNAIVAQKITMGKNVFYGCKKMTGNIRLLMPLRGEDGNYDAETMAAIEQTDTTTGTTYYAIPDGFLSGCQGLTGTLTIPNFIQKIGNQAFQNCSGIEHIEYENNSQLEEIGDYAFAGCSGNIEDIAFPTSKFSNTIKIGKYSYYEAKGGKIDLTNVSKIGEYCFAYYEGNPNSENCKSFIAPEVRRKSNNSLLKPQSTVSNVVDVELGNLIATIPEYAFAYSKICDVYNSSVRELEYSSLGMGKQVFYESTIKTFTFSINQSLKNKGYFKFNTGATRYILS